MSAEKKSPPRPSRRQLLGYLGAAAGLAGCDRFDATSWFSRGRYDVDRRFRESTQELSTPLPPALPTSDRWSALVFSDCHFWEGELNSSFQDIADYLAEEPVDLMLQLGDLADAGWISEYQTAAEALEIFDLPIYWAIGNHDVWNEGWRHYRHHFGSSVYTLRLGQVLVVFTDVAGGTLGGPQRDWLEDQLAETTAESIIVLGHYPLWSPTDLGFSVLGSEQEVYDILDLLRRYDVAAHISGHTHRWAYTEVGEVQLYTVSAMKEATTSRSALRIDADGPELSFTRIELADHGAPP